jgi:hypothetical protein
MSHRPSLSKRIIGLSMSPPNDLTRLGYPKREFRRLVFELVLRILRAGGRVCYGGHLQPDSLLVEIVDHLAGTYVAESSSEASVKPLLHFLPLSELRKLPFTRLAAMLAQLRPFAETRVPLSPSDQAHLRAVRGLAAGAAEEMPAVRLQRAGANDDILRSQSELDRWLAGLPAVTDAEALSIMRRAAARTVDAWIVLGGKRGDLGVASGADAFAGTMPGIYEEALIALDSEHPVSFLAGFGGGARDAAAELGLIEQDSVVPTIGELQPQVAEARRQMRERRSRIAPGSRQKLAEFAARSDTELLARDLIAWLARRGRRD